MKALVKIRNSLNGPDITFLEVDVSDETQPEEIAAIADPPYAWLHDACWGSFQDGYDVTVIAVRDVQLPCWGSFQDGYDVTVIAVRDVQAHEHNKILSSIPKKEIDMSTPIIAEHTTFHGQDIAKMGEAELLKNIKKCNEDIKTLKDYGVSSKKISARIAELEAARKVLVDALDGPDEPEAN